MRRTITILLFCAWLLSFGVGIAIPLLFRKDFPDLFSQLLKQPMETFAPQIGGMLAFVFANPAKALRDGRGSKLSLPDWVALAVTVVYLGIFNALMIGIPVGSINAEDSIKSFELLRPALSFLVTGMIVYYFGSPNSDSGAAAKTD